jgi:hypothetical protein
MNVRYELRARFLVLAACAATVPTWGAPVTACNVSPVESRAEEDLLLDKDAVRNASSV